MSDIYFALAAMLAISAALYVAGLNVAAAVSRRNFNLIAILTVVLLFVYMKYIQESVLLTRLLPFSNLIVLGAWQTLFGAFLGGMAWQRIQGRWWRKSISVVPLLSFSFYGGYGQLLGNSPWTEGRDYWRNGVCMQSSASSCSAAAAATLLTAHGIPATESEMARLCFTRSAKGTSWLGLYRGLKLKTAGTDFDVEVFRWTRDELQAKPPGPIIISVRLDPHPGIDPRFERNWGWQPGVQHAVVLFEFEPGGRIEMGDPSTGREYWNDLAIGELWHGDGMRLVRRNSR